MMRSFQHAVPFLIIPSMAGAVFFSGAFGLGTNDPGEHVLVSSSKAAVSEWPVAGMIVADGVDDSEMLSPARLEAILLRTGISAKALTAAGCDAEDIDQVVSDVSDYLITNSGDLNNAHADYANARRDRDILARTVRSGTGAAQDVTEYQAAVSNLASAASARQTALDAIFDAGCDSLTQNEVDLLTVIRANLHWNETSRIDMEFLTITRIESNWVELDEVLEYERYCGEVGESMDQDIQAFLTSARANATVSAAASRLSDNLNANKTAWDIAVDIYGQ